MNLRCVHELLYEGEGITRVYELYVDSAEVQNKINNKILEIASELINKEDDGIQISNIGPSWHSGITVLEDSRLHDVKKLFAHAVRLVENKDADLCNVAPRVIDEYFLTLESWLNLTYYGGGNSLHNHAGACWSGVYYPLISSSLSCDTGGQLIFHGKHSINEDYIFNLSELSRIIPRRSFTQVDPSDSLTIFPQTGLLIIFPSWLPHRVEPLLPPPSSSDGASYPFFHSRNSSSLCFSPSRLSLAFNFYTMLPRKSWIYDPYFFLPLHQQSSWDGHI
uniref:Fe2OG dioxygenase domain-containing protein n=1 Tax=Aureoumbra lagunensis TaxID=44058 RepID=A0A7S3NIL3_9STRA